MNHNSDKSLFIFFALSLGFSLLIATPSILENFGIISLEVPIVPLLLIGSWTPNFAAFIVLIFVLKKSGGVKDLFKRWLIWKASPLMYLVAISPLLISFIAAYLYIYINGSPGENPETFNIFSLFGILILSLITGAMGEELGWRGFALPRLQARFSAFISSVIIGIIWGLWHFPLWFAGIGWESMSFIIFLFNCIVSSIIITWLCNNSSASILLVTLYHMFYNFGFNLMSIVWNIPQSDSLIYLSIALTIYAAILLIVFGGSKLKRSGEIPIDIYSKSWI